MFVFSYLLGMVVMFVISYLFILPEHTEDLKICIALAVVWIFVIVAFFSGIIVIAAVWIACWEDNHENDC